MNKLLLELQNVSKRYRSLGGLWGDDRHEVHALYEVSLRVHSGESYGLVGESGSGKSTLARLVLALEQADSGCIFINDADVSHLNTRALRALRRKVQIIFQDPYGALNPLMTVGDIVAEPLINYGVGSDSERSNQVIELLRDVGLPARLIDAYPHQLSGGERQRVCIARALALRPKLLVCDEPVSALDKSIQAQILNLLGDLQKRNGLAYLFISHDLAVVNYLCTHIAVMLSGHIVEDGERLQVLQHSAHPYTRSLTAAAAYFVGGHDFPELPPAAAKVFTKGCVFQHRCLQVQARCREEIPRLWELTPGHRVACHFPL